MPPISEEDVKAIKANILEIEQSLEELKKRPATPDRVGEIDSLKKEITELRRDLSDALKLKKTAAGDPPPAPKGDEDDVSLGHFGGK